MDDEFAQITISFDGTHRLWDHRAKDRDKDDWSYKLKDCGYNFLVNWVLHLLIFQLIGHPIGWWYDCGEPMGASTNDISLFQQAYSQLPSMGLIPAIDAGICDRVFANAIPSDDRTFQIFYGHRKDSNSTLTLWQERENKAVSKNRGD